MSLILPCAPQFSRYESNFEATPNVNNSGTQVNHGATPHTKVTTWTQLIASTAFDAQLVIVTVNQNSVSNGDSSTLLDIGIGASTAEVVLVPDIAAGFVPSTVGGMRHHIFPLYVPAGSRLSARTQSVRTTGSVNVLVQLYGGPREPAGWWCGQTVTTYGANAANSAGAKFTPGNSGAEGSAAVIGTTSIAHKALVLGIQGHPDDVSFAASQVGFIDVGENAAAAEWYGTDMFEFYTNTAEYMSQAGTVWWPVFRPVPAATELIVQAEMTGTADAYSAVIHGIS